MATNLPWSFLPGATNPVEKAAPALPAATAAPKPAAPTAAAPTGAPPPIGTPLPLVKPQVTVPAMATPLAGGVHQEGAGMIPSMPGGGLGALTGAMSAAGQVPGAAVSRFGPGNDLRGAEVLPGAGPDRFALAQSEYARSLADNQQSDFDATRAIAQRASAAGRLGAGGVDDEFNRLARTIGERNASARTGFLDQALAGTIGDQQNNRGEIRDERAYQSGQGQQNLDNNFRQFAAESGLGFGNDPTSTLLQGSSQLAGQAAGSGSALQQLLQQYAYGRSVDPNLDQYGRPQQPGAAQGAPAGASTLYGQRPGTSYYGG